MSIELFKMIAIAGLVSLVLIGSFGLLVYAFFDVDERVEMWFKRIIVLLLFLAAAAFVVSMITILCMTSL